MFCVPFRLTFKKNSFTVLCTEREREREREREGEREREREREREHRIPGENKKIGKKDAQQ